MHKKYFYPSLILIFYLAFSCSNNKPLNFFLSNSKSIQILEEKDHIFCSALKIDYDQTKLIQSQLYWGCRLSITKHHFIKSSNPNSISHNRQINELIDKIKVKMANLPEGIIYHANKQINDMHHAKCLKMGYEIATLDNAKIDDYYKCRSTLINEYKLLPPYRKAEYLKYPNNNYDLNFAINRQIELNLAEYEKQKKEYPQCVKYNLNSPNFKLCTNAHDKSRSCYKNIKKIRYKKELREKINCQRLSFLQFPDNLIKFEDDENNEISKQNNKYDYYNNNNFAALGIDAASFKAEKQDITNSILSIVQDQKEEITEEKIAEIEEFAESNNNNNYDINNNNELYSKFEVTQLRQSYIEKCRQEVDRRIKLFIKDEEFKCEELKKFEKIGE